jgi:hypothetical protein
MGGAAFSADVFKSLPLLRGNAFANRHLEADEVTSVGAGFWAGQADEAAIASAAAGTGEGLVESRLQPCRWKWFAGRSLGTFHKYGACSRHRNRNLRFEQDILPPDGPATRQDDELEGKVA